MTKIYAVIGDPIEHSLSPSLHNTAFKELNLDCSYIAYRIPKGELEEGIHSLKKIKIDGFNVTIPHKIEMMKYLDKTDESCSVIGAANTVTNKGGILKGYNTDMDGFMEPIKKKIDVKNLTVLLLGSGGAARAIVAGFAKEHARSITIANRNLENANCLAKFSTNLGLEANAIKLNEVKNNTKNYDIIVNATPLGLKNETIPISLDGVNSKNVVYDIVYMPINTEFLKKAKEKGASIIYGYEMLLGQATRAFEIFHGVKAPYAAMKKVLLGGF